MKAHVTAIVLAGGKNSEEMRALTGVENRALVSLGDKTMLDYVIDALKATQAVGSIIVIGSVPEDSRYTRLAEGATMMDNLFAGLNAAQAQDRTASVLVSTSDIPFITADGIDDFVTQSLENGADLCYPIIGMDVYNTRFQAMRRTTLKVREGRYTGGNMVLINPTLFLQQRETISQAYAARKSVFKLGGMLGPALLLRIILSQTLSPTLLPIALLEQGVAQLIGPKCRVKAIVTQYPEIGTDVDKPDDMRIAQTLLAPSASIT